MQQGKCRLDIRNHLFPGKVAKVWSRLPREVQILEGCKGCADAVLRAQWRAGSAEFVSGEQFCASGWCLGAAVAVRPTDSLCPLQPSSSTAGRCGRLARGSLGAPRPWLAVPAPRRCSAAPASPAAAGGWGSTWR